MTGGFVKIFLVVGFVSALALGSVNAQSGDPAAHGGLSMSICADDWTCGRGGGGGTA